MPALLLALAACGDPDWTPDELCAGEGPARLTLGSGTGEAFDPFAEGQEVDIAIAPQGGYGVSVRMQSFGLVANAPVQLELWSTHLGEPTGAFAWGEIPLYCMDDGSGLMWGAVVPFDPERFPTLEDLSTLDGERVTLGAEATDVEGEVVRGTVEVVVRMPER